MIGTPAVRDGTVYVGTSDSARFMALDARSGRLKFNFDAKAYVFSSAALAGGAGLLRLPQRDAVRRRRASGAEVWAFRTPDSLADRLELLDADGRLDPAAFAPLFGDFGDMYVDFYRFASLGAIMSSPAVVDGVRVLRQPGRASVRPALGGACRSPGPLRPAAAQVH